MNPGASEDGTDWVDDDCDGSPLTTRVYVVGFEPAYTNDWSTVGNVSLAAPGLLRIQPTATTSAGIELKRDVVWKHGRVTVNVRFTQAPTTACTVIAAGPTTSYSQSLGMPTAAETVTVAFTGILPDQVITDLKVSCAGAGTALVDWLTVQNGPYVWGPLMDIGVSFSTMGFPEAGHGSFVRMSEDSNPADAIRMIGSDVGGIAWSEDGHAWYTANGTQDDLNTQSLGGVWDAWSPGEIGGERFTAILVGNNDGGEYGGLFYTDDITDPFQSWTMVPGPAGAPAGDGGIGATKWDGECGTGQMASSGKLLVEDLHDGSILVGSTTADYAGVWVWDPNSPNAAPVEAVDGTHLPTDYVPYVSALAVVGDHLFVGYRLMCGGDPEGPGHESALFDCPDPTGAFSGPLTCMAVVDPTDGTAPLDVRDLEALPVQYDGPGDPTGTIVLYVADGGQRFDGTSSEAGEATVFEVIIDETGVVAVADTDTQAAAPAWAVDAAGAPVTYRSADGCAQDTTLPVTAVGNLIAPEAGTQQGRDLSSILLTPDNDALLAFYPQASGNRDYGCVRIFRAALNGSLPLDWLPLQGWEGGELSYDGGTHAVARRTAVEVHTSFMDVEPLLEVWGLSAPDDAAWEPALDGNADPSLLTYGLNTWRLFSSADSPTGNGWDTPPPALVTDTTLDALGIELAWDGTSEVYQSNQGRDLAVCRGCAPGALADGAFLDSVFAGASGDYRMAFLHARGLSGNRAAADHPCQVSMLAGSAGLATAVWEDPNGLTEPEVWMTIDGAAGDAGVHRGLLHLDDVNSDEWCFDGYDNGKFAVGNYIFDILPADTVWDLVCQDSYLVGGYTPWLTCDQSADELDSFNMPAAGIGSLWDIVAVGRDYAIAAASPAGQPDLSVSGGGLWILHHDGADGVTYTHVPPPAAFPSVPASCTEDLMFADDNEVRLTVDEQALYADAGSGAVSLYYTVRDPTCGGAWRIDIPDYTAASPGAPSWTWVAPAAATCPFSPDKIYGVEPTRDGRILYAWGGSSTGADGGVCRVDTTSGATEVAFPPTPYLKIYDVLAHPHLDDVIWIAAAGNEVEAHPGTGDGGVYLAQRRFRPGLGIFPTGTWAWGSVKHGYYDLEDRRVVDLQWGVGHGAYPGEDPSDPAQAQMSNLYATMLGGGWWDGALDVE